MSDWQPIETAPFCAEQVMVWVTSDSIDGDGWVKVGTVVHIEPLALIDDNGCEYWPHENGGYPTHWMPLPSAPA